MMKKMTILYKWIIISVLAQCVILITLNIYFGMEHKLNIRTTIEETLGVEKQNITYKIPSQADSIKVSYDGAYVGYILDGNLIISDLKDKKSKITIDYVNESKNETKTKSVNEDENRNGPVTYYRWLPDRDMIIYAVSTVNTKTSSVAIITYDVNSKAYRAYPLITNLTKESKVEDIELSPNTNIVYAKINTSETLAAIYRFNIMDEMSYVMKTNSKTIIKETSFSDKLVYQDEKNKLYSRDGAKKTTWTFPFKTKMALLEIDAEDRVFVGELNSEGKVAKISNGYLSVEPDVSWSEKILKTPVLPQNILITRNGSMYALSEKDLQVNALDRDYQLKYKGKFVEIIDDYLVTAQQNEITLTLIRPEGSNLKK